VIRRGRKTEIFIFPSLRLAGMFVIYMNRHNKKMPNRLAMDMNPVKEQLSDFSPL